FSVAQPISDRIEQLKVSVNSLPAATQSDQVKKAVLELALEQASNAVNVNYDKEAEDILLDIQDALNQDANFFIERNPKPKNLSGYNPLLTVVGNPYLDKMVDDANTAITSPDNEWPRTTPTQPVYDGINGSFGTRSATYLAQNYFWLFAHEQSPMHLNAELLKRSLRRMHTFADLVSLNSQVTLGKLFDHWYDQFSVEQAFPLFYEIVELYPNLLLPSQKRSWDNMIQAARSFFAKGSSDEWTDPWNYNIESARMLGILNIGFYLNDQKIVSRVLRHADKCIKMQRLDGAMPYHGDGRPSVNYHNVLYKIWLIMYEQTGYEPLREAIERSQWKGPATGRTDEFWTSPFSKTYRWNIQKGTEAGMEAVATLTNNAYVRGLLDRNEKLSGSLSGGIKGKYEAVWYNANIPALPLPDNYTITDRNIGGPRAWYGDFTYAGSYRAWSGGHQTLMGAMTVDSKDGRVNSILVNVTPRIWVTPQEENKNSAFAELTDDEVSTTTVSKNYSVGTSVFGISQIKLPAYKGPDSDWNGRQMWIGLEDRIIGLVSTVPKRDNAKAYAIHGAMRLISGGSTGAETLKELETLSPTHYRYGQLEIIVHDQKNYQSLTDTLKPYRRADLPATELIFSDRSIEPASAGTEKTYSSSSEYRFVVEVRPIWADVGELTRVNVLGDKEVIGLEMIGKTRSLQVWLNAGENDKQVNLQRNRLPAGNDSFVLSKGITDRAKYQPNVPTQTTLAKGQHALIIVSDQTVDHQPGWTSFSGMAGYAEMQVTGEKQFGRVSPNDSKEITYTITNLNEVPLKLTGTPKVEIEGDPAFSLVEDATLAQLDYGDQATFKVRFRPTSEKEYEATVKINSNVKGNEVYEVRIAGAGNDEVLLTKNSPFGTSWENPAVWEDGEAAQSGKKYLMDRSYGGSGTLRTPTAKASVFPGEQLKVANGAYLLLKTPADGVVDIKKVIFNGGGLTFSNGGATNTWKGEVIVEENGIGIGKSGTLVFEGALKGDGPIKIDEPEVTFLSGNWNGDIEIKEGILRFGFAITRGRSLLYKGGTFDINGQNHQFQNLFIEGTPVSPGVYTASDLGTGFTGSGTIMVKPFYQAAGQLIANGKYAIQSKANGKYLASNSEIKWNTVTVNPGNGDDQRWVFRHLGDNIYEVKLACCERYLEVPFGECNNASNVGTWKAATKAHQKWKLEQVGEYYVFKPTHCLSQALDRKPGAGPNGSQSNVHTWEAKPTNKNQLWSIIATGEATRQEQVLAHEKGEKISVQVFPNPLTGSELQIKSPNVIAPILVDILSLDGKVMYHTEIPGGESTTIQLGKNYDPGIYLVKIQIINTVSTQKLIVK
ncbi:MAG: RICIN domain-containing protein, partial [Bacteroidota bacterium]